MPTTNLSMDYYVAPTSGLTIVNNNSSNSAEITISLSITGVELTFSEPTYISGVNDLSTDKKNPGMPYCEIYNKVPTITDNWKFISINDLVYNDGSGSQTNSSGKNQLTLNLKTKLKQLWN